MHRVKKEMAHCRIIVFVGAPFLPLPSTVLFCSEMIRASDLDENPDPLKMMELPDTLTVAFASARIPFPFPDNNESTTKMSEEPFGTLETPSPTLFFIVAFLIRTCVSPAFSIQIPDCVKPSI